ncbi:MAG: hypothetical protein FJ138_18105 [Deltaproteobacteria bacterium]|nr:hypothetical protein [Deltaproteobacteria bacterium]
MSAGGDEFVGSGPTATITPNPVANREALSGGGESCAAVGGAPSAPLASLALLALLAAPRRARRAALGGR